MLHPLTIHQFLFYKVQNARLRNLSLLNPIWFSRLDFRYNPVPFSCPVGSIASILDNLT